MLPMADKTGGTVERDVNKIINGLTEKNHSIL